jgi:hypothetical protein
VEKGGEVRKEGRTVEKGIPCRRRLRDGLKYDEESWPGKRKREREKRGKERERA